MDTTALAGQHVPMIGYRRHCTIVARTYLVGHDTGPSMAWPSSGRYTCDPTDARGYHRATSLGHPYGMGSGRPLKVSYPGGHAMHREHSAQATDLARPGGSGRAAVARTGSAPEQAQIPH